MRHLKETPEDREVRRRLVASQLRRLNVYVRKFNNGRDDPRREGDTGRTTQTQWEALDAARYAGFTNGEIRRIASKSNLLCRARKSGNKKAVRKYRNALRCEIERFIIRVTY